MIWDLLPEELPKDVEEGMLRSVRESDALGGPHELLSYRRESWCNEFDEEVGFPLDDREPRPKWAAACTCGACGSEWHWGWNNASEIVASADFGCGTQPWIPGEEDAKAIGEGEAVPCPFCGEEVLAISRSALRNGRTYRCMMGRAETLGGRYTAVIFWMLERVVAPDGSSDYSSMPWAAVVVGSDGKIYSYSHTISTVYGKRSFFPSWQSVNKMGEPINSRYYSWEACNKTMVGGFFVTDVPDQTGCTGEKTGLAEYLAGNGEFPLTYLKAQRRWPQLENLVKAGWVWTVDAALNEAVHGRYSTEMALREVFDLSRSKPKEMLGIPKDSVGWYGRKHWDFDTMRCWRSLRGQLAPDVFLGLTRRYSTYDIRTAAERWGARLLPKLDAYLQKQGQLSFTYYGDYRRMLAESGGGETSQEIFPPDLRRAHDRASAMLSAKQNAGTDAKFVALAEKWGALEWGDGVICAVLPRKTYDLTAEGKTLQHCVGGYVSQHLAGKMIIFIRHARRPERSWYTLNIDVSGEKWREVQLHGYKNEFMGSRRLTIPREVRAFVDRWEREVLEPAFRKVKKAEKKEKEEKAA